jgi:hypothetical protein
VHENGFDTCDGVVKIVLAVVRCEPRSSNVTPILSQPNRSSLVYARSLVASNASGGSSRQIMSRLHSTPSVRPNSQGDTIEGCVHSRKPEVLHPRYLSRPWSVDLSLRIRLSTRSLTPSRSLTTPMGPSDMPVLRRFVCTTLERFQQPIG